MNLSEQRKKPGRKSGTPFKKCTKEEFESRIEAVELLLARKARRMQIHAAMRDRYDIGWRMTEIYVAHARARRLKRIGRTKEEMRLDSEALYNSVIQDPVATPSDKIRAQNQIDELWGLKEPRNVRLSGDEDAPIQIAAAPGMIIELPAKRPLGQPPDDGNGSPDRSGSAVERSTGAANRLP